MRTDPYWYIKEYDKPKTLKEMRESGDKRRKEIERLHKYQGHRRIQK